MLPAKGQQHAQRYGHEDVQRGKHKKSFFSKIGEGDQVDLRVEDAVVDTGDSGNGIHKAQVNRQKARNHPIACIQLSPDACAQTEQQQPQPGNRNIHKRFLKHKTKHYYSLLSG